MASSRKKCSEWTILKFARALKEPLEPFHTPKTLKYSKENWIEGGGDWVYVHFAVPFLDCWRTSFCVTTKTKAADLM